MAEEIQVEVAYALPHKQKIITMTVPKGITVYEAARQSGIDQVFPEIDWENCKYGVLGKAVAKPKERVLEQGERVEIYRPLIADPKEVRKKRAAQAKQKREAEQP
ncbi:RnfH family protein [Spartinivicinus ruber]|uniref:RnfH family protein n=1 Tax=Spartinivicinus ruber TaxID=2683272 RepID=UPI0013D82010|nr:RnfH family protein [Spartinivicinus ruber]